MAALLHTHRMGHTTNGVAVFDHIGEALPPEHSLLEIGGRTNLGKAPIWQAGGIAFPSLGARDACQIVQGHVATRAAINGLSRSWAGALEDRPGLLPHRRP